MADDPFIQQCKETPVTALTCAFLTVVWFPLWNNRIGVDSVAFSYVRVVQHHEWWRILTASHSHFEPFHLLFNVMALWSCRHMEMQLGPSWIFLAQSLTFAVACKLLMLGVLYVLAKQFPEQARGRLEQWTVGYSAVIFAWMTVLAAQSHGMVTVLGLVDVPAQFTPLVSLLIVQLLVRNASFLGHAAGIVVGGLHALGLFDWLTQPYWAAIWCLWIAGVALVSLRATTRVPVPCITYVNCWGENGGGNGHNGAGANGQGNQIFGGNNGASIVPGNSLSAGSGPTLV